ncbi:MAG: hypothetical protein AMJ79_00440 [Phycisphaerae bacterium SM23_30]|nr:MAG: hypothetical protein AMJ79_00440 [Phycisphaerae bacterium SM23_30]
MLIKRKHTRVRRYWTLAPAALVLMSLTQGLWAQRGEIAVKAGKIITAAGETIENGTILVRDGKITQIGQNLRIPLNARVIDASEKVVIPGLVVAHSSRGMDQENERNPEVPFTSVLDSVDTGQAYFDDCRRNGITSIAVVPGNDTRIGGQAAVIKTRGIYVSDMILKRSAGIKISLDPTQGESRLSHRNNLRKALKEIQEYIEELEEKTGAEALPDVRREAMCRLLKGEIPAFLYVPAPMDVAFAVELAKEFHLKVILVLGRDCYKAVDQIAESGLPVILDGELVFWERNERTEEEKQIVVPQIFREAGVKATFQAGTGAPTGNLIGTNFLWFQAATAMKYGASAEEALRAITLLPAEILGIEKFVGSLEEGKDADMVILSGDPLELNSWVETVIADGEVIYEIREDKPLQELLKKTVGGIAISTDRGIEINEKVRQIKETSSKKK